VALDRYDRRHNVYWHLAADEPLRILFGLHRTSAALLATFGADPPLLHDPYPSRQNMACAAPVDLVLGLPCHRRLSYLHNGYTQDDDDFRNRTPAEEN
jgi:hypothetical protein